MLEPWAFIAIGIAVGLFGVLAIQTAVLIPQQAEAEGCENGRAVSTAANASKGRCFGH
jgi:hypothetical protein